MKCEYCGLENPQLIFTLFDEDRVVSACPNCAQFYNTCRLCANSVNCEFETNPSPLPKQVMQTIHQGNMTMQTVIPNPERIKVLCADCPCRSEDATFCCKAVAGTCKNYTESLP